MPTLSDFSAPRLDGALESLSIYSGRTVLVVNVASGCGLTQQYEGLERLFRDYRDTGFVVLGFPCNQFGGQESGSDAEIASFCSTTYDVTFPMFRKLDVNGPNAHPLFNWLKSAAPGFLGFNDIKWNFTKFLVGRDGAVIKRIEPGVVPADFRDEVVAALG